MRLKIVQVGEPVLRQFARPLLQEEIALPETQQLIDIPPEYLAVLQAWDGQALPADMGDIGEAEACAYVDRHLAMLGVPQTIVDKASRQLSLAALEAAPLKDEPVPTASKAASVAAGIFMPIDSSPDEAVPEVIDQISPTAEKRRRRKAATSATTSASSGKRKRVAETDVSARKR